MKSQIPHPSWIEVDLTQFKRNIEIIKAHIGKTKYCLPVKANAYGHGLLAIAEVAQEAGVDYLAVAHLSEGAYLREANIVLPILVLGAIHEEQIEDLIKYDLELTLSSKFKADLVAYKAKRLGKTCRVHLEIDTGMQRTGVRPESAESLLRHVEALGCFEIKGIYSHLATADTPLDPTAQKQIRSFTILLQNPLFQSPDRLFHLANSGATAFYPDSHFDMVRPTLMTLGYPPPGAPGALAAIEPCFSVKSKVSYFKVVGQGSGISYGHKHTTEKQTRIVTVPVGYGDGYNRSLSNLGSVLIRGQHFPIVGSICMDQFMVDVGCSEVYVGDEVVLLGRQNNHQITACELAEKCGTITYEILCAFNNRLPRVYV